MKQLQKVGALFFGFALLIGYVSVAYAHGSDPNIETENVIGTHFLSVGLGIAGYLLMVNELPQKLFRLLTK